MTVSLEKCFVEVDNKKVPALDPSLITQYKNIAFESYIPYHVAISLLNSTPLDEQIKNREIYLKKQINNIKQLLQLNFSTFWNFILNRKERKNEFFNSTLEVVNFVENYCRGCIEWMQNVKLNRQKEKSSKEENWEYIDMPDNICNLEGELSQYIFLLVTRLSFLDEDNTYNHTLVKENNSWSEATYQSNIKKFNIFSIPFLFDFINLYYESNKKIVKEILTRIIKVHPTFNNDIVQSVSLTTKLANMLMSQATKLPILLMSADEQYQQLLGAVEEVVNTYVILLENIDSDIMKKVLFKNISFIQSIISLYQVWCTVPNDNALTNQNSEDIYSILIKKFKKTALNLLFVHLKLNYFDKIVSDRQQEDKLLSELKNFLNEILDVSLVDSEEVVKKSIYMENSLYIVDFDICYGLVDELTEMSNKNTKTSFKDLIKNIDFLLCQSENQDTRVSLNPTHETSEVVDDEYINRTMLISGVQELFPDLGDGFIDQCLLAFNNNPETVIAKLLDNDLPPNIQNLSRTTKRKQVKVKVPSEFSKPLPSQIEALNDDINENPTIDEILKERRNVFDNDEFDILRNGKIDMNKVILGKKNRGTFEKVFDDKSKVDKEQIKSIVNHYDMYDDEYDDTWDGINEFNVNIDNNGDDKDDESEDPEKTKRQDNKNSSEGSSDPGVAYKTVLMKWLENHPDVFLRNNRKSNHRKQLIEETGMSNEQIEGWYTMYQRNKKNDEAKNKSKSSTSQTPPPQTSSNSSNEVKVNSEKRNNNNNNHIKNNSNNNNNRNRSNKNNNNNNSNNKNNNNNSNKNQFNKNKSNNNNNNNKSDNNNNNNSNRGKDNDKVRNDTKDNSDNKERNSNEGKSNNNSNRRNNSGNNYKGGNKSKGKDGEKSGASSSEKSNKPHNSKKRSDADNHYRKAGRQRKLNQMMGGFE